MDALRAFAARRGVNLDLALERLGFVREAHVAFAAAEQGLEDGPEMISDLGEGLEKQRLRRLVDFAGRLLQRVARGDEVVALGLEELEPLGLGLPPSCRPAPPRLWRPLRARSARDGALAAYPPTVRAAS